MKYKNYLLGQGFGDGRGPMFSDSLVLSIDPDGEPLLGFYEGLHPRSAGGSVPIPRLASSWTLGTSAFTRTNTEWMIPLFKAWLEGSDFDLDAVLKLYRQMRGHDPEVTDGRFSEFPSVRNWRPADGQ